MTPTAIAMFVVAVGIVWGGLVASILYLRRHAGRRGAVVGGSGPA